MHALSLEKLQECSGRERRLQFGLRLRVRVLDGVWHLLHGNCLVRAPVSLGCWRNRTGSGLCTVSAPLPLVAAILWLEPPEVTRPGPRSRSCDCRGHCRNGPARSFRLACRLHRRGDPRSMKGRHCAPMTEVHLGCQAERPTSTCCRSSLASMIQSSVPSSTPHNPVLGTRQKKNQAWTMYAGMLLIALARQLPSFSFVTSAFSTPVGNTRNNRTRGRDFEIGSHACSKALQWDKVFHDDILW